MVTPRMSASISSPSTGSPSRLIAAAADGSTGTVVAIALAGGRRHLSGSAHGDIAAAATAHRRRCPHHGSPPVSVHRAVADGDVFAVAVVAAADACTIVATGSSHRAALDGDAHAAAGIAAADACTVLSSLSGHRAAADGDGVGVAVLAAADARTIAATGSRHRAAGDGDVFAAAIVTAADARTIDRHR